MSVPSSADPLLRAQAQGFVVGGEPLAVDLADTVVTVTDPPTDLLADDQSVRSFWALQGDRLPPGADPLDPVATRALRDAVRALLDARLDGSAPPERALETVNRAGASAPTSPLLRATATGWQAGIDWHGVPGPMLTMSAVARSAVEVLTGGGADRLRRCANPACSMLFVADDARRKWCTSNRCGNRTRVARHYQRHHGSPTPPTSS